MAVPVFMIYSNMVSMSQAWIAQEKVPASLGMWGVHVVMVIVLVVLFLWRMGKLRAWSGR
jgi:lipopolysaccharide export system permease protein